MKKSIIAIAAALAASASFAGAIGYNTIQDKVSLAHFGSTGVTAFPTTGYLNNSGTGLSQYKTLGGTLANPAQTNGTDQVKFATMVLDNMVSQTMTNTLRTTDIAYNTFGLTDASYRAKYDALATDSGNLLRSVDIVSASSGATPAIHLSSGYVAPVVSNVNYSATAGSLSQNSDGTFNVVTPSIQFNSTVVTPAKFATYEIDLTRVAGFSAALTQYKTDTADLLRTAATEGSKGLNALNYIVYAGDGAGNAVKINGVMSGKGTNAADDALVNHTLLDSNLNAVQRANISNPSQNTAIGLIAAIDQFNTKHAANQKTYDFDVLGNAASEVNVAAIRFGAAVATANKQIQFTNGASGISQGETPLAPQWTDTINGRLVGFGVGGVSSNWLNGQ